MEKYIVNRLLNSEFGRFEAGTEVPDHVPDATLETWIEAGVVDVIPEVSEEEPDGADVDGADAPGAGGDEGGAGANTGANAGDTGGDGSPPADAASGAPGTGKRGK